MAGRRPRQKAREAKQAAYRQLVLDAAEGVFARKGYEAAKMEEIAAASGIALGTLYSVFSGKAEIFRAVHEAGDRELLRRAQDAARDADGPLEALLAGVRAYADYFIDHPDFLRMHLREGFTWGVEDAGAGSRQRTAAWTQGVEMLTTAFRRCMEAGLFAPGDPRVHARMMIAMQQVQLADWVETGASRDPQQVVREITDNVVRAFCIS